MDPAGFWMPGFLGWPSWLVFDRLVDVSMLYPCCIHAVSMHLQPSGCSEMEEQDRLHIVQRIWNASRVLSSIKPRGSLQIHHTGIDNFIILHPFLVLVFSFSATLGVCLVRADLTHASVDFYHPLTVMSCPSGKDVAIWLRKLPNDLWTSNVASATACGFGSFGTFLDTTWWWEDVFSSACSH